jgi:hypothetical protein
MIRLVFLLEEPSMKNVLEILLPKIIPHESPRAIEYSLHSHSGKSELKKSIPKKIKIFGRQHSYNEPVIVVILHDQHSHDCVSLKHELVELCRSSGNYPFLIRIVCKELESWYLGDMEAIEKAYPGFKSQKYKNKRKFPNPVTAMLRMNYQKFYPSFIKVRHPKPSLFILIYLETLLPVLSTLFRV